MEDIIANNEDQISEAKKKEYKPILLLYLGLDAIQGEGFNSAMKKLKKETGYSILIVSSNDSPRAELLSVDKATVVEDVQKYIDEKFLNSTK